MKDSLKINTVVGQSLEYLWIQSQDDKEYFIYWLGDPVIKRQLEEENKNMILRHNIIGPLIKELNDKNILLFLIFI